MENMTEKRNAKTKSSSHSTQFRDTKKTMMYKNVGALLQTFTAEEDKKMLHRPTRRSVDPSMKFGYSQRCSQDLSLIKVTRPQRWSTHTLNPSTSMSVLTAMQRFKSLGSKSKDKPLLENTYRLDPKPDQDFNHRKVENLVQDILDKKLKGVQYSPLVKVLAKDLSDHIKSQVKELDMPRYKIVCQVLIVQNQSQGIEIASHCLWDVQRDDCLYVSYHSESLSAVVCLHAVYFE